MEVKRIKPSFYNMFINKSDGLAIYNTFTGKLIRCFDDAAIVREYLVCEEMDYNQDNIYISELYSNGMLIDASRNEIREMEEKEEKSEFSDYMQLILLPTEQCNFRCVYCYEKFERGKMTQETQDWVVKYVEDNIDRFTGLIVIWFGGEPTGALDVMEDLSARMIEICKRKKKVYNAGITTNGYSLDIETFKKLKRMHVTDYQVTIDGLPSVHDRQRVLANGEKTFDVIMNNLVNIKNNVKSSTITFVLRTNISKDMMRHMDDFCELLGNYFKADKRFKFFWQLVGDYGYVKEEGVRNLFGSVKDYKWLIENYTDWFINSYTASLYGPDGGVCYALKRNSLLVDANGNLRKCTCDLDEGENWIGTAGVGIDKVKHENWINKRLITSDSACYHCKKRPLCHNRQCYKAKKCLLNYMFLEQVLEQMSEKSEYYKTICGGIKCLKEKK